MTNYYNPKAPIIVLNTPEHKTNYKKIIILLVIFAFILPLFVTSLIFINQIRIDYNKIPTLKNSIITYYKKEGSVITDRYGEIIFDYRQRTRKETLKTEEIPELIKYAILVREDENFFNSAGFAWKNFAGALVGCARSRVTNNPSDCRGGSGIYQQLIKNFDNNNDRSIDTKYNEILKSLKASEEIGLEEALAIYLNNMDFGRLSKGVAMGSKLFFNHAVTDKEKLTPAKACFLAIMPNQPTAFTTATKNMLNGQGDMDKRPLFKWSVLNNLVNDCVEKLAQIRIISDKPPILNSTEVTKWLNYDFKSVIVKDVVDPNEQARYYIKDYIEEELLTKFPEKFPDRSSLEASLHNRKLDIRTTFDLTIQDRLEKSITDSTSRINEIGVNQLSSVVINTKNSEMIAMQGNLDYNKSQLNRLSGQYGYILPGSSTKPYYFASVFDRGFNPATVMQDAKYIDPVIGNVRTNDIIDKYQGNVNLRYALQHSINTISEQVLYLNQDGQDFAFKRGVNNTTNFAEKLGLVFKKEENNCLNTIQVAVGSCPVYGLSHVNAMSTLANNGVKNEIKPIISVKSEKEDFLSMKDVNKKYSINEQVIDPLVAKQTINVMADYKVRRDKAGSRSDDAVNYELEGWNDQNSIAVKSGTAQINYEGKNQSGELSVIGSSPIYTTLLWAGNNNAKGGRVPVLTGSTGITPIFKNIMGSIHQNIAPVPFDYQGLIKTEVNRASGLITNNNDSVDFLTPKQNDILKNVKVNSFRTIFENRTGYTSFGNCNVSLLLFDQFRFRELRDTMQNQFTTNRCY